MIVSLVSGTFNRLQALRQMVNSFRDSIGVGLDYEIVLVDGGSTDGTIKWCREQLDVALIEQGELLGAVKAFDAGFKMAKGKYVIIGNDDIMFIDESVRTAIAFMEDHDNVGIGCFYQDRESSVWHVGSMPAVVDGRQASSYYGQVCIVPKWLGDMVGWWGKDYHTYAGDNELSCQVLELGFKVEPIDCACIHDDVIDDKLRETNRGSGRYVNGTHPDTALWASRWRKSKNLIGPTVRNKPTVEIPDMYKSFNRQARLLYAPIYEKNNTLQHRTKSGLRDALVKRFLVTEVDYIENPLQIFDVANAFNPDIVLTQFHDASVWNINMIWEFKAEHPYSILINWNGDYFPQNFLNGNYVDMMKQYDLATFVTTDVKDVYDSRAINWRYWQIGYEECNVRPLRSTPKYDVLFIGNSHYDFRVNLGTVLVGLRPEGINVGLYGSWPESFHSNGYNLYDFIAGHRLYQNCKIAISDGRPDATGFVSNRLFQAMYAGALVFQQYFEGIYALLGLEDGKHLIVYHDTEELPMLVRKYLKSPDISLKIAETGRRFITDYHSFDNRVSQLIGWINDIAQRRDHSHTHIL